MIKINNNITEEGCLLYGPKGEETVLIGKIKNAPAFYDVRLQIKQKKLEGYYILFQGERYYIDKDGRLPVYPINLFPAIDSYLEKLIIL
jgi:hypothetical protein